MDCQHTNFVEIENAEQGGVQFGDEHTRGLRWCGDCGAIGLWNETQPSLDGDEFDWKLPQTHEIENETKELRRGFILSLVQALEAALRERDEAIGARDTLIATLKDILRVTRESTDSPLEDAFGHALSYIEEVTEGALKR
jgi:hypothetical protein